MYVINKTKTKSEFAVKIKTGWECIKGFLQHHKTLVAFTAGAARCGRLAGFL